MQETRKTPRFLACSLLVFIICLSREQYWKKTIVKNDHKQNKARSRKHRNVVHLARTFALEDDRTFRFTYKKCVFELLFRNSYPNFRLSMYLDARTFALENFHANRFV